MAEGVAEGRHLELVLSVWVLSVYLHGACTKLG